MKRNGFHGGLFVSMACLLCILLLAACGQKGQLYLPADSKSEQQAE